MCKSTLELKLDTCLTAPDRRFLADLAAVVGLCCKARNAAMLHWYVWRKSHPDWKPGDPYEGPPVKQKRKPSKAKDSPLGPKPFINRELYSAATAAAPELAGILASSCVRDVLSRLRSKKPYNQKSECRFVWQQILANEVNLPTWTCGVIPVPNNSLSLGYMGHCSRSNKDVERGMYDACLARFPLFGVATHRKVLSPVVRLHAGDLSAGRKRILCKLVSGEWKLGDSKLSLRKGKWYLQLSYESSSSASGLPDDRALVLLPNAPGERSPFVVQWEQDGETKRWYVGKAIPLAKEYERVVARRRAIRYRYSDGLGSGHGKKRFYRVLKPMSRSIRDAQTRFTKQTISDICKFALGVDCGKIIYREPSMPIRDKSWFADRDIPVPFDWTAFGAFLAHKTAQLGLVLETEQIRMAEWTDAKTA